MCHILGLMNQGCKCCKSLYYVSELSDSIFNKYYISESIILELMLISYSLLQTFLTENNVEV